MARPYLELRWELEPAVKGALGGQHRLALEFFGSQELACRWAGHPPLLAGFQGPD